MLILLFFYFKQKTAYEMRISDWSSDVCSSDLDDINLDGLQQVLSGYAPARAFAISNEIDQLRESAMFILRLREAVVDDLWGGDRAADSEAESEADDNDAETVSDLLKLPIAMQPIAAASAEIQRVRDELHNKTAATLLTRSEEHPSELQSLMRIS